MALTGWADGPPVLAPAPLATVARESLDHLRRRAGSPRALDLDAAALLGERAALRGLGRAGQVSPGGSCRLLACADGWIAVNLARPDDRELLPAWLGQAAADDPWRAVAARVRELPVAAVVERGRLLGLAVAPATEPPRVAPPAARTVRFGEARARPPSARPTIVDLSSLWAGPLCAHLLNLAGARVIKLESTRRPDGARSGTAAFFDLLNAGKQSAALDFSDEGDRVRLRRLLDAADLVIESARPRALSQLGVDADAWVAARPGRTWISITGYGRTGPEADRVAFGDDAAVAAGLAAATGRAGEPLFCGDAIADPIAGLAAAAAALESWQRGGGHRIDVALCDGVARALARRDACRHARVCRDPETGGWRVHLGGASERVRAPRARSPRESARSLGADTGAVLAEFAC